MRDEGNPGSGTSSFRIAATPQEFKARFDREYAELEKVIRAVNITIN